MINILFPMAGVSSFFENSYFPKHLYEICGKTMLERVVENFSVLNKKNCIFVILEKECIKFHLDDTLNLLLPNCSIIEIYNETKGALCTCMLAIEYIDNNEELIISNSDQIIDIDYNNVLNFFRLENSDAGVITFQDIHPRWSYAKKKIKNIVEVAEKRPFTKDAIAGFYYFKKGKDFVEASKKAIIKQNNLDGKYYISLAINEMILYGKKISYFDIDKKQYKSFYSPEKIKEYESEIL